MSDILYCPKCGKQNLMGGSFCAYCGKNLKTLSEDPAPPPVSQPSKKHHSVATFTPFDPNQDEDGNEDDERIDHLRHLDVSIDKFDVEIVKDRPLGESLASVISQGEGKTPSAQPGRQGAYGNMSDSDFQKLFSQEAGPMSRNEKSNR